MRGAVTITALLVLASCGASGDSDERAALEALYEDPLWHVELSDLDPLAESGTVPGIPAEPLACEGSGQEPVGSRSWRTEEGPPDYSVIEHVQAVASDNGWTVEDLVSEADFADHDEGTVMRATRSEGDATLMVAVGVSPMVRGAGWTVGLAGSVPDARFCD